MKIKDLRFTTDARMIVADPLASDFFDIVKDTGLTLSALQIVELVHARSGTKLVWLIRNKTGVTVRVGGPTGALVTILSSAIPVPVISDGVDFSTL